jgi:phospholipase/carboxylesterase
MNRLDGPKTGFDGDDPDNLVALLHGYGSDSSDMIGLAKHFAAIMPATVFHAPQAPHRCDQFPEYFQWYPMTPEGVAEPADVGAISASLDMFLDETMQQYGLDESRTALLGFSQGTALALHAGVRRSKPLAGNIGFSGGLEFPEKLRVEIKSRPPVLLVHGDRDDVAPVSNAHEAAEALRKGGIHVDVHIARDVGHRVDPTGFSAAWRFLYKITGLPVQP